MKNHSLKSLFSWKYLSLFILLFAVSNAAMAGLTTAVSLQASAPGNIKPGEITRLEITLSNNNNTSAISNVAFSNTLPGTLPRGLKVAGAASYTCFDPSNGSTSSGAGTFTANINTQALILANGSIPARDAASSTNGSCTLLIPVTAGTDTGDATNYTYTILSGAVAGNDGAPVANSGDVSQSINIIALAKPSISKSFSSSTAILGGAARTLTITISNSENVTIPNFSITDTFPSQGAGGAIIKVAATPNAVSTCNSTGTAATFNPAADDTIISATGGTVAAKTGNTNGTCTIKVDVEARHTNNNYQTSFRTNRINAISDFSNDIGIRAQADATRSIRASSPLQVSKSFSPSTLADGQNGTMTITLRNNGDSPLTVQSFTDSPIDGVGDTTSTLGLKVNGAITANCNGGTNGAYVATANNLGIELTVSSTIAAGQTCIITTPFVGQTMVANTPITYTNTISQGAVDVGDVNIVSQNRTATILVSDTLRILKSRNTSSPRPGNPVQYAVTVQNWSASDMLDVQIVDVLDNGMTFLKDTINGINYTPTLSSGCGALTVTNNTGDTNADFEIATVPQRSNDSTPGACMVTFFAMVAPSAGTTTSTSTVNSIASGAVCKDKGLGTEVCNGGAASSNNSSVNTSVLTVNKSFSSSGSLNEGSISRMTITLNNFSANPLTSVSISDTLPSAGASAQMQIASPANASSTCGGTITVVAGGTSIALNNASVPGRANKGAGSAGSCNLQVDVVGPAGNYTNTATAAGTETYANGNTHAVGPISDNATLIYNSILSASKGFNPDTVASGGRSTVTVRLANSGTVALANVSVTDPLPTGMVVASPANAFTTCSGAASITANSGDSSVAMTGATIAGTDSCDLKFDVIASGTVNWVNTIPAGGILATDTGVTNQSAVSGTLTFNAGSGLTIVKDTNPSTLAFPGQASRLTITINNGTQAVTNLSLNDFFTSDGSSGAAGNGMVIASNPSASTTCSGGIVSATPSGASVKLRGASLNANANCNFAVNVTSTIVGGLTNFIPPGAIANAQGLTNAGQATTSLTTQSNLGVVKKFIPDTLKPGVRGRLRLTFFNPQNVSVSSLAVIDTLPAGVVVPSGPNQVTTCAGAVVSSPAANQVQVVSGVLGAATGNVPASCYAEIDILAAAQGDFTNTIDAGGVTAVSSGVTISNSDPSSDTLRVKSALTIHKAFSSKTLDVGNPAGFSTGSDSKLPGQSAVMTIRLENSNDQTLTQAAFTDTLPSGLFIAQTPNASTTCTNGTVTALASEPTMRLSGATIPANGNCTVTVSVLSNIAGSYTNTIAAGGVTTLEGVVNDDPTNAELIISTAPSLTKEFSPAVIPPNGTSTLTITLENDNEAEITLSSILTDTLPGAPGAMTVETPPNIVKTCSGTVTAVAGNNVVSYANGSKIPAGGCTISVDVTATTAGTYNNSIPVEALKTNLGNNQQAANASLEISNLGYISGRVFKDNNVIPNGTFEDGTDSPIAGVEIELRSGADCSGTLLETETTDDRGNYLFFDLNAGNYSVCEASQPSGTLNGITTEGTIVGNNGSTGSVGAASNPTITSSEIVNIVLNEDGAGGVGKVSGSPANDFAEIAVSSISGTVFLDGDNDGIQDGIDTGIDAVSIELSGYSYGNNGVDEVGAGDDVAVALNTTTDSSGDYSFNNLAAGQYTVTEPNQPTDTSNGMTIPGTVPNGGTPGDATNPATVPSVIGGTTKIILPPNTHSPDNDFAEIGDSRSILGIVFLDFNDGGTLDGSDHGIGTQTLNLTGTDISGNVVSDTTTTTSDGSYIFSGLPPGTYTVTQPSQPASTANGKTSCVTAGCAVTNQATTPSVINAIDLTGTSKVSAENNFAEIPLLGAGSAPNLAISKTHSPDSFVEAGDVNLFSITPSNIGTADTSGTVTVVDTLPAGITASGVPAGSGWSCAVAAQIVTCTSNDVITAGTDGNVITLNVSIASGLFGQLLTNTAVISGGSEPASFADNNTATDIVSVATFDFGDAPDTGTGTGSLNYKTLAADAGASHILGLSNAPYLGACVDSDPGSLQNNAANADDSTSSVSTIGTCASADDDEDGVVLNSGLKQNVAASIDVTASSGTNACVLNAWIDYNQNGDFEAGEQIANDQSITAGTTANLVPVIPAAATPGITYARFRCSSTGGLNSTGIAADGEVEDYQIVIQPDLAVTAVDFGDAPDSSSAEAARDYTTIVANNGPSHVLGVTDAPYLGACVDSDAGTAQNTDANADDLAAMEGGTPLTTGTCATASDDEDGVALLSALQQGVATSIDVTSSTGTNACILNAWIDFNADGDFLDSDEQIASDLSIASGTTTNLTPVVPAIATVGATYARFRCNSTGGLTSTGLAADGEIEDYRIVIQPNLTTTSVDFGDAPDNSTAEASGDYSTIEANNGPSHTLGIPDAPYLGACVDSDAGTAQNTDANADDIATPSGTTPVTTGTCLAEGDEDGVSFNGNLSQNLPASIDVTASSGTNSCLLNAWIDYNQDGDFNDAGEMIATDVAIASGATENLTPTVPTNAVIGKTYSRFRCATLGGLSPTGVAADGEVEDHLITIVPNLAVTAVDFGDAPDITAAEDIGDYSTTEANNGPSHALPVGTPYLGACVDSDSGTAQNVAADADDGAAPGGVNLTIGTCAIANQDEDGISLLAALLQNSRPKVQITTGLDAACVLNGWIDFNQDGVFSGTGEQIISNVSQAANTIEDYQFNVPINAKLGGTYARFRCSSAGGDDPVGSAADGEVEDYRVTIQPPLAPANIPTLSEWGMLLLMLLLAGIVYRQPGMRKSF